MENKSNQTDIRSFIDLFSFLSEIKKIPLSIEIEQNNYKIGTSKWYS